MIIGRLIRAVYIFGILLYFGALFCAFPFVWFYEAVME